MNSRTEESSQANPAADTEEETLACMVVPIPARGVETVCHRTIHGDPAFHPQAEYHGQTIYFCTETCQSVFLSDPERFYAAHSKRMP